MKDYFSEKAFQQSEQDLIFLGTCYLYQKKRAWFNPLKYLMGKIKLIRISPSRIYINYK